MSSVSRRTFLATPLALAIGASMAGCTAPPAPVLIDPDREALEAALSVEQLLLAETMQWTGQAVVSKGDVSSVVQAHIDRLVSTLGSTAATAAPSPSESSNDRPSVDTASLRGRAQKAAASHTRASRTAGAPTAQLLASLAASDAAIAAALGQPT